MSDFDINQLEQLIALGKLKRENPEEYEQKLEDAKAAMKDIVKLVTEIFT